MNKFQHQTEEVSFIQVPGTYISSQSVSPPPDANYENSMTTYNLLKSKKYAPNNDSLCIVPVMPAVPPFIDESLLTELRKHVEISAPLKGNKSPYSDKSYRGYRSGSRSGIIFCRKVNSSDITSPNEWIIATDSRDGSKYVVDSEHGNILIRVKGCGMWIKENDIPFPSITLKDSSSMYAPEGKSVSEIRGVCFENTSCTEMIATSEIEENLRKVGLVCGNHPLGFWIYENLQNDISPLITKTVSLFETYGDRRLESHLFPGLELLISKKFDQSFAQHVIDLIEPLYEDKSKLPGNTYKTTRKRFNLSPRILRAKILDGSFLNLNDYEFEDLSDDAFKEAGIIPTHEIYEKIKDLDKNFVNLVKTYGRIGFEIGRCISIVHRTGYLWGTYSDHSSDSFHVNAHPDNLIVLSKETCLSQKKLQVVAPVDFDMSFKRENAINFWRSPPKPDITYNTENVPGEIQYMADAIGGFYATFEGVSNFFKPRKQPDGKLCNILYLLRDCALYEYYQGYQKINSDGCKGNEISVDDIYDVIEEALNESFNHSS